MISDSLVRGSSGLLAHLAEPAARAIALGCVAAIVLGALRVKRVPLRLLAWTTVLYGAVVIALAGWLLPGVSMRVPGSATLAKIAEANHAVTSAIQTLRTYVWEAREAKEVKEAKEPNAAGDAAQLMAANSASAVKPREYKAGSYLSLAPLRTSRTPRKAKANSALTARLSAVDVASSKTLPETQIRAELGQSPIAPAVIRGADSHTPQRAIPWVVVAAGIYAAIALLLLARLLLGVVLSHRLAWLSEPIRDADAVRKLRFRAYASGLESVPRLAESELVSVPATLCVFRPLILLPAHWREWDAEKFDAILAHEVSHVARRDSLTQRISLLHRAIFWFSPLAWWLDRKLNELAEEASDEAALGAGADKKHYAETLLSFFADLEAASGRVWWQGVSMASEGSRAGHAERRVERILAWGGSISMKKSLGVVLVAIAAPVIFFAAAVHPVVAQDKTQDDSKNVIMPGGPKAPALPNAPKGGVSASAPAAPAIAAAPQGGVNTPPMPPAPNPALAPVGPIQIKPSTPSAPPQGGVSAPSMPSTPRAALGPSSHHPGGEAPSSPLPPNPSVASVASLAPAPPETPLAAIATAGPQSSTSSDVRQAEAAVRAAKKQVEEAKNAMPRNEDTIRDAQQAMQDAEQSLAVAREAMREAEEQDRENATTITHGTFNMGSGPRYVMMSRNSNEVNMSGDEEDLQHARELRKKINSDFIWFQRDEKSYIITDPDFIAKAKALFAPEEALAKQQDELGRQQDELGRQQDAIGQKMEDVKVKIRDITPELEAIRARLKELNDQGGATQEELGRLQSRLGQLQSEVGRSQSEAGVGQSAIGRQQGELGRKQGELGRRQGELGRQQGEIARKASRELRDMFADAIQKGIAKPE